MPWGDDAKRLLARVHSWPATDADAGLVNIQNTWEFEAGKRVFTAGKAFRDPQQAVQYVGWLMGQVKAKDIYFCTSLQAQTTTDRKGKVVAMRNVHNTLSSKVLFLDIDVKTPPKGYATRNEALLALRDFCKTWKLPIPSAIVGSGGGIHCYWISNRPMLHAEWQPLAEKLRAAGVHSGLRFDGQCTVDMVRILRVPETQNWKTDPPTKVELLHLSPNDYDFATQITPALDAVPALALVKDITAAVTAHVFDPKLFAKRAVPASYAAAVGEAAAGIEYDTPPLDAKAVLKGCGFLRETLRNGGAGNDQPLWNLTTLTATFMGDKGRQVAHAMSKGHSTYNQIDTDALFDRKEDEKRTKNMGWPSCGAIEQAGCKDCALCPHRGKIRSPLNLGTVVAPAAKPTANMIATFTASGNEPKHPDLGPWPVPLPFPYTFNEEGVVCKIENRKEKDADGNTEIVPTLLPLLNKQHIFMPHVQHDPDAIVFTVDGNLGMLRKVYLEREHFTSAADTKKVLGRQGVAFNPAMQNHMGDFLMDLTRIIEMKKQAMRAKPFGWLDVVTKGDCDTFLYGGIAFHRDGTESPGGYMNERMTREYGPVGSIEPFKKCAKFVLEQKVMPNILSFAVPFAAPIMEFTGQHIGMLSKYGPGGEGKSTTSKMALAVWSHPEDSRLTQMATEHSVGHKMGTLANLPVLMDEITDPKSQLAAFNQMMQDGKERERLVAQSGVPLAPRQSGKWYTICEMTSNRSFLGFIAQHSKDVDAPRYRVFEVHMPPVVHGNISHWDVEGMLMELRGNFGMVGLAYAKYLAMNSAGLKQRVKERGKAFDLLVGTKQQERFWSALCTCLLLGAEFAKENGWVDFDLPELEAYLVKEFLNLRRKMLEDGQDTVQATMDVVTSFIKMNRQKLMVSDNYNMTSGRATAPINCLVQPAVQFSKGVVVQFVDKPNKPYVMIEKKAINDWLVDSGHQPSLVMGRLKPETARVTLGRGTEHAGGQERVYLFDISPSGPNYWLYNVMKDLQGKSSEEVPDPQASLAPSAEAQVFAAAQTAIAKDAAS